MMRSFDPLEVGSLECRAWETYYRRKWVAFLIASVRLVRAAFGMNWPRTLVGAWLVLVKAAEGLAIDTRRAAELEVEWWRAHREDQYASSPENAEALIGALADLYAYTYGVEHSEVRRAAELRAEAMDVSDRWVAAGCDPQDPLLAEERALLVRSFAALLAAVHRPAR